MLATPLRRAFAAALLVLAATPDCRHRTGDLSPGGRRQGNPSLLLGPLYLYSAHPDSAHSGPSYSGSLLFAVSISRVVSTDGGASHGDSAHACAAHDDSAACAAHGDSAACASHGADSTDGGAFHGDSAHAGASHGDSTVQRLR